VRRLKLQQSSVPLSPPSCDGGFSFINGRKRGRALAFTAVKVVKI